MTDIPDTEYITVKRDANGAVGIFVGEKPATTYRGLEIYDIDYVKETFVWMQEQNPNIMEWHVMSSKTHGEFAEFGNPSFEHGRYAWCRVKNNDGQFSGWVFAYSDASATACASLCASDCAAYVRAFATFRRAVFDAPFDKQKPNPEAKPENPKLASEPVQKPASIQDPKQNAKPSRQQVIIKLPWHIITISRRKKTM